MPRTRPLGARARRCYACSGTISAIDAIVRPLLNEWLPPLLDRIVADSSELAPLGWEAFVTLVTEAAAGVLGKLALVGAQMHDYSQSLTLPTHHDCSECFSLHAVRLVIYASLLVADAAACCQFLHRNPTTFLFTVSHAYRSAECRLQLVYTGSYTSGKSKSFTTPMGVADFADAARACVCLRNVPACVRKPGVPPQTNRKDLNNAVSACHPPAAMPASRCRASYPAPGARLLAPCTQHPLRRCSVHARAF